MKKQNRRLRVCPNHLTTYNLCPYINSEYKAKNDRFYGRNKAPF